MADKDKKPEPLPLPVGRELTPQERRRQLDYLNKYSHQDKVNLEKARLGSMHEALPHDNDTVLALHRTDLGKSWDMMWNNAANALSGIRIGANKLDKPWEDEEDLREDRRDIRMLQADIDRRNEENKRLQQERDNIRQTLQRVYVARGNPGGETETGSKLMRLISPLTALTGNSNAVTALKRNKEMNAAWEIIGENPGLATDPDPTGYADAYISKRYNGKMPAQVRPEKMLPGEKPQILSKMAFNNDGKNSEVAAYVNANRGKAAHEDKPAYTVQKPKKPEKQDAGEEMSRIGLHSLSRIKSTQAPQPDILQRLKQMQEEIEPKPGIGILLPKKP